MKINGINFSISESHYNKSEVQKDGITHKIDTNKKYPMYILELHKIYFDGSKKDTLNQVINDLEAVINKLKQIRDKEIEQKENYTTLG